MIEFTIKQEGKDKLDLIQPLWEKLNQHHYENSVHFKNRYKSFTWNERKEKLIAKSAELVLFYVTETESNQIIGYCISSVEKDDLTVGEIDSVYIEDKYRKLGIGLNLLQESVMWLEAQKVKTQKLMVSYGNEGVFELYKKLGFYPLNITLQKK
jgi:L-amino acid N-acyltransferase YncA